MALRHYGGGDVPKDQRVVGAPPGPPPAPRLAPTPAPAPAPRLEVQLVEEAAPDPTPAVRITVEHGHIFVDVTAPTLDEAVQQAAAQYESAQPIKALVWQDGTPVEGLPRDVLLAALETYQQYLGAQADPIMALQLGRLRGALGVEDDHV